MDRSLGDLVGSLVPTYTGTLPPELLDLARSLFAQSRTKIGNLKAEEETARQYTCAHLACERLKQQLNLPRIEARPPCRPRVYDKLFKYFDQELSAKTGRNARAQRPAASDSPASKKQPASRSQAQQTSAGHRPLITRLIKSNNSATIDDPPKWVMPSVRSVCRELKAPAAIPHIFAGVSSILKAVREEGEPSDIKLPAIIIVLFIFVYTRLSGAKTDANEFARLRQRASEVVNSSIADNPDQAQCQESDVDDGMMQLREHGWIELDWFLNVEVGCGLISKAGIDSESEEERVLAEDGVTSLITSDLKDLEANTDSFLQPGLGTMLDSKLDFLSDAHCNAFEHWRTCTLQKLDATDAGAR